jgi:hypothetical protein
MTLPFLSLELGLRATLGIQLNSRVRANTTRRTHGAMKTVYVKDSDIGSHTWKRVSPGFEVTSMLPLCFFTIL